MVVHIGFFCWIESICCNMQHWLEVYCSDFGVALWFPTIWHWDCHLLYLLSLFFLTFIHCIPPYHNVHFRLSDCTCNIHESVYVYLINHWYHLFFCRIKKYVVILPRPWKLPTFKWHLIFFKLKCFNSSASLQYCTTQYVLSLLSVTQVTATRLYKSQQEVNKNKL